jgi:elongation factor P
MDNQTYEQPNVAYTVMGDDARWLRENMELEEVIDYNLPLNIDLEVVEAEQGIAGDTATGATKEVVTETGVKVRTPLFVEVGEEVVTETGVKVRTPLFVEVGDKIRVDTRSGEYVTRV